MPTVAEQLKAARVSQGLSIHQVADATKMRSDHVDALENGRYSVFPAPVYARGSVRTYAALLKLDPAPLLAALDRELTGDSSLQAPGPLGTTSRTWMDEVMLILSRIKWRILIPTLGLAALILIGVAGFRAWKDQQSQDPLRNLGPGRHSPSKSTGTTLPLPTPPKR